MVLVPVVVKTLVAVGVGSRGIGELVGRAVLVAGDRVVFLQGGGTAVVVTGLSKSLALVDVGLEDGAVVVLVGGDGLVACDGVAGLVRSR